MAETQRIYGIHAVESVLKKRPDQILTIWLTKERRDKRLQALYHLAEQHRLGMQTAEAKKLDTLAGDTHHQGVVAEIRVPKPWS